MPLIRPISDLRKHFSEISNQVHETQRPVFLTKNGYADMVVMLYRPERCGFHTEKDSGYPTEGLGVAIVAKHRNGSTGKVYYGYNPSMTRIGEYEPPAGWIKKLL